MKKNAIPILGYLSIVSLLTILFFSCKKSTNDSLEIDSKKQGTVYEYIKKLGFRDSEIKDIGDDYLVDAISYLVKTANPIFPFLTDPKQNSGEHRIT